MKDLHGRVAAVTGGASGIGLALAQRFVAEGMKVAIGDVEKTALDAAVAQLEGDGAEVLGVVTDVTDAGQMQAFADATVERFGAVHVFCNNAGVGGGGLTWEAPLETWEWVLGVNLWGIVHGIRAFVPLLLAQPEGHIVNTASVAGLVSAPFMSPYCASKHAVVAISESLHYEFQLTGANVKVSVLCPGWVNTRIAESERNRPAHLAVEATPEEEEQREALLGMLAALVSQGIPTDEVAGKVIEAIRNEQFWVLTHDAEGDQWGEAVNRRIASLQDRSNPPLNMLA